MCLTHMRQHGGSVVSGSLNPPVSLGLSVWSLQGLQCLFLESKDVQIKLPAGVNVFVCRCIYSNCQQRQT